MNSFRGGMQVHAVPPEERAYDSRGQQLPWGYSYADSNLNRKQPLEKGPFGRATTRRSMSRSKTATPATRDDLIRQENNAFADDVFGKFKTEQEEKQTQPPARGGDTKLPPTSPMPFSPPPPPPPKDTAAPPAAAAGPAGPPTAQPLKDPTEMLLYGFSPELQYAAIEYFERVSRGRIYEDYDRHPPHPKYATALAPPPTPIPRALPPAAVRRINTYHGGEHWIKVTFDSPEAAEVATHFSPAVIQGHLVFAELFRGMGPSADVALFPDAAGNATAGSLVHRRPPKRSRAQHGGGAFATVPARGASTALPFGLDGSPTSTSSSTDTNSHNNNNNNNGDVAPHTSTDQQSPQSPQQHRPHDLSPASPSKDKEKEIDRPLRIPTATRARLRPASEALLPVPPWTQRAFGGVPVVGALFGGEPAPPSSSVAGPTAAGGTGTGVAGPAQGQGQAQTQKKSGGGGTWGGAIPRREDGSVEWERVGWWWRMCWWVDWALGTDLVGVRGDA